MCPRAPEGSVSDAAVLCDAAGVVRKPKVHGSPEKLRDFSEGGASNRCPASERR
jgi:hypothetical protein